VAALHPPPTDKTAIAMITCITVWTFIVLSLFKIRSSLRLQTAKSILNKTGSKRRFARVIGRFGDRFL
jgi:hypothetical protein